MITPTNETLWIDWVQPAQFADVAMLLFKGYPACYRNAQEALDMLLEMVAFPSGNCKVAMNQDGALAAVILYQAFHGCDDAHLVAVTVQYQSRNQGIASWLVDSVLASTNAANRRKYVTARVPETALAAQLFLKSLGFLWFKTEADELLRPDIGSEATQDALWFRLTKAAARKRRKAAGKPVSST